MKNSVRGFKRSKFLQNFTILFAIGSVPSIGCYCKELIIPIPHLSQNQRIDH